MSFTSIFLNIFISGNSLQPESTIVFSQKNVGLFAGLTTQVAMSASLQHQLPWQSNMSLKTPLVCDRCFLGGPLNVRGFRMFGVGPHSDTAALGTGASLAYSAHLYAPLPGIKRTGGIGQYLRLHGFLTAGHVGEFQGDLHGHFYSFLKERQWFFHA